MLGQHLALDFAELPAQRPPHPHCAPLGAERPEIERISVKGLPDGGGAMFGGSRLWRGADQPASARGTPSGGMPLR